MRLAAWRGNSSIGSRAILRCAPPADCIRYTANLLTTDTFWVHLSGIHARLRGGARDRGLQLGLADRVLARLTALSGDVLRTDAGRALLHPQGSRSTRSCYWRSGSRMPAKIAFGAIHGIIPIALFTINALRNIKPILIKAGRVLRLSPPEMIRSILFPAAVAGDLHRLPRWIFADLDRNPAWRDVCIPAWSRLPP